MSIPAKGRGRWVWAVVSMIITLAFLQIVQFHERLEGERKGQKAWLEELAAWEAEQDLALRNWEKRQLRVDTLLSAPRGVGHVAFLDESGIHAPGGTSRFGSHFAFAEFRKAADLARQGEFFDALKIYRVWIDGGDPRVRVQGVPLYLLAWLRTVELLAHVDARTGLLVSMDLGTREILRHPHALEAAELALAVRVFDRVLKRYDAAMPRIDVSAEALEQLRKRSGKAYNQLRMMVKALRNREAWSRGVQAHLAGLRSRGKSLATMRYGFLSMAGSAPVLNVLRRVEKRMLLYSFDPSELLPSLKGRLSRGSVHSITFDRTMLASRALEGLEGRSRSYAATDLLPGLVLHVFFPTLPSGARPEGGVLSPARRPARIHRAALDLVEAMYEELGKGNKELARERYAMALQEFPLEDGRRSRALSGQKRCLPSPR